MSSEPVSRKPKDTPVLQQLMSSWQPILNPRITIPSMILIGIAFIVLGIVILQNNSKLNEVVYDYTDPPCSYSTSPKVRVANSTGLEIPLGCNKTFVLTVPHKLTAPISMYYELTRFYQNHRKYAASRYDAQLAGEAVTSTDIDTNCDPMKASNDGVLYNPCGIVAWSMFNDSVAIIGGNGLTVCNTAAFDRNNDPISNAATGSCTKKGVAWHVDREKRFRSPSTSGDRYVTGDGLPSTRTSDIFTQNGWYANEAGHKIPYATDEDLMVWMRPAALPSFRKLWRTINVDMIGEYTVMVTDRFDVNKFSGRKKIVLVSENWGGFLGGPNTFLGLAYLIVGIALVVTAAGFLVKFITSPCRAQQAAAFFHVKQN